MQTSLLIRRWLSRLAWLGGVLGCCVAHAQGQERGIALSAATPTLASDVAFRQFGKVEITGSSIIRKEQTTSLPVQVITRDDIRRSGASSMADVLHKLPIMSMVVNSAAMNTTIGGYTTASLRGLPAGTLLLMNGKRLAAYGRQSVAGADRPSVDIDTIPLSAVDKIEVLSDGASSLYGTDAIAGVINIITRNEQKGVEIAVAKLATTQGGGAGQQISLNAGLGRLQSEGYSLRLTLEAAHRDALQAPDRPQYTQGRYLVERDGKTYALDGSGVTEYTTPGVFAVVDANGKIQSAHSPLFDKGTCPPDYLTMIGHNACLYNGHSSATLYPQQDSQKLLLSGEKWLTGGVTGYAEILHTTLKDSEFFASGWPQRTFKLGTTPTSVGVQEAQAAGLDPAQVQYRWSPSGVQGLRRAYQQDNWRAAAGLKGAWDAWDYHASLYKAQAQVQRKAEVSGFATVGWVNGQTLTDPNMLKALMSDNPLTAQINGLRNNWTDLDAGTTRTSAVQLRASRPLSEIDGQDVMLGVGAESRHEATDYRNMNPSTAQPSFQAQRDIQAAHVELMAPLTPQWDLTLASRVDRYSDFGTTQNSKLSSRFDFQNGWTVRGSWGTGFRAPSLAQMQDLLQPYQIGRTAYLNDCTAEALTTAARLTQSTQLATRCDANKAINLYANGNPDLKPEQSAQKSLGLAYRPTRNFSVTADWWSIDMKDVISIFSDGLVYNNPLLYPQNWVRESSGALAMQLPNYNIGRRHKTGIDFDLRWRTPSAMGQWHVFAQGTYNLLSEDQVDPDQPFVSDLARYNRLTDSITPRLRMRWLAGLTTVGWSLHAALNHTSAYADQDQTGVNIVTGEKVKLTGFRVPSFTTLDVSAAVQLHSALSLRATVGNVLNQPAPQAFTVTASQVFGFNTREHNLWGRTLHVALVGKF